MTSFFSKKTLINYISDSIDINFFQYGPALTISGILTTPKKVFLVEHVSISMTPPSQSIKKEFNWFTLQPYSAVNSQFDIINPPQKFTLSPNDPYKYNIMLVDDDCYSEIKTLLLNVSSAWTSFQENATEQQKNNLFNTFCKLPITIELNDLLKQSCYWQTGKYTIDICTAVKGEIFTTSKHFFLNDEDVENLKNNSETIIANICRQASINFYNATVPLTEN